jgi:lysophospholipase L1-like esterase
MNARCLGMRDSVAARWLPTAMAGLPVMLAVAAAAGSAAAHSSRPTRQSRPPAHRAQLPSCSARHWVGSWIDSPSDADSAIDASLDLFAGGPNQTLRMIITPHLGGNVVRVHLSNRVGSGPVTFSTVTIARAAAGAALVPGSVRSVTFNHSSSVTVPAGEDVVSDPVGFSFTAFDNLAVSMYLAGYPGLPTEHFTARQTSYYTPPGAGDQASDPAATPFTEHTTARYYVDGLDVMTPDDVGSVVAFGDSITDGYQGPNTVLPENTSTLNTNGRWPDDLQRRLIAAGDDRISILNAGISGNRILDDGQIPMFGPSGLSRFRLDALDQPGVTEVIVLEGINDIGQSGDVTHPQQPSATPAQLEAGYEQLVTAAHAAHLKILLGTLTPTGGTTGVEASYSSAQSEATREAVNAWIRSGASRADGFIDFDAAVRNPADPTEIAPAYNGGDSLHFNLAGYQALADAVDLSRLEAPACRRRVTRRIRRRSASAALRDHRRPHHGPRGQE